MANNDERILQLRETIAKRREELKKGGVTRFVPITDCSIPTSLVGNESVNINTLGKPELVTLGAVLVAVSNGYKEFGVGDNVFPLHGRCFTLADYLTDVSNRIRYLETLDARRELDAAEKKLSALLSDNKKTELAIDDIVKALGI